MFKVSSFQPADARELAAFINWMRTCHWPLTSLAFARRPDPVPLVKPQDLVAAHSRPEHIDTVLLRHRGRIVSVVHVDDRFGDGRVAVFSQVETHPDYQRRGTFWRFLGNPCLRKACAAGYERLEAVTWPLNRKGIPLFKRVGFRVVPGTALLLENYLPLILRHPGAQPFLAAHDYLRTLRSRRGYGQDAVQLCGLELFIYEWRHDDAELRVEVDRRRRQVVSVGTGSWTVRCFLNERLPGRALYHVCNHTGAEIEYAVAAGVTCPRKADRRRLPPGQPIAGQLQLDQDEGEQACCVVSWEIQGRCFPFALRPLPLKKSGAPDEPGVVARMERC